MAGLLTANMLRRYIPTVMEAQPELPDNHGALLRFRTEAVQNATGQLFQKVMVNKAIKHDGKLLKETNLRLNNMYSLKVAGEVMGRSSMNLESGYRYIAPDDFIATMARGVNIEFGKRLTELPDVFDKQIISTIPMPVLMDVVGWSKPEFKFLPIWTYKAQIENPPTKVYQTIYYPDGDTPWYRASITGNQLIVEYTVELTAGQGHSDANHVLEDFGIYALPGQWILLSTDASPVKYQHYGKLLPIDERERQEFILHMSDKYGVYSIGRFATWRQLLMDDIVNDVKVVERFINQRASYKRHIQALG